MSRWRSREEREEKRVFDGKMAERGEWKSADGRITRITEMDDTHLDNAIKVLEGKGVSSAVKTAATQMGVREEEINKKTQLETEEDIVAMMEAKLAGVPSSIMDKYNELVAEREARQERGQWKPAIRRQAGGGRQLPRRR